METIVPREYQLAALDAITIAWTGGIRRQLVTLPTGTGKTVIFCLLAKQRGGRTLILVHRHELVQQTLDKLRLVGFTDIGVVKAERNEHDRQIVVASVQTLSRPNRLAQLTPDFATVIVDEAHHSVAETYRRVLEAARCFEADGPLCLGCTATADRGDGQGLDAVFEQIVFERPLLAMIDQGFLSDLRAVQVRLEADFNQLHVRAGDFITAEMENLVLEANAPQHVVAAYLEHAAGRRALVFTPSVHVAHVIAARFQEAGIAAEALDGTTPLEERRAILERLRTGETLVVPNCAVLTEGFDEPALGCIVIARPTRSRSFYTQMVGRSTRPFPGKPDCLILDLVGATERHDLMTAASLFGFAPRTLAGRTVTEAAEYARTQRGIVEREGELIAKQVELFQRARFSWIVINDHHFTLSLSKEHGTVHLRGRAGGAWVVHLDRPHEPTEILAEGPDLGYVRGAVEDHVRKTVPRTLWDRRAGWRQSAVAPTDKQLALLHRLRAPRIPETKGEASDLITTLLAQRRR